MNKPNFQSDGIARRHCQASLLAFCLLFIAGCAARQTVPVVSSGPASTAGPVRLELGAIGLSSPAAPAAFSFDKASGRIESAADAAGNAAGRMLETSTFDDPALEMAAGGVRFALGPFAAAAGALGPGHAKLSPQQLKESEFDLTDALSQAAEQQLFRDWLLKTAEQTIPNRLVPMDSPARPRSVLQAGVDQLCLERVTKGDDYFVLRIKAKVKLLRSEDGSLLYEQPFEFRSGQALFIDWTRHDALQSVADTGYRELASHIVNRLFSSAQERPVLLGAGHKNQPPEHCGAPLLVSEVSGQAPSHPAIEFVNPIQPALARAGTNLSLDDTLLVRQSLAVPLDVYSIPPMLPITLPQPFIKDEAVPEAIADVEWALDGLDNSHNSVVMLLATTAAIPISLWHQTAAGLQGLRSQDYRAADASLTAAAQQNRITEELAFEVSQQLVPRTSQPIMLVKASFSPDATAPEIQSADLGFPATATVLEIELSSAALTGQGELNPQLALGVEGRATLRRKSDSQQICSIPIRYRSQEHKFLQWAAHDARLFRAEMDQCRRQMARAMVDGLVARQLLAPEPALSPTLAGQ